MDRLPVSDGDCSRSRSVVHEKLLGGDHQEQGGLTLKDLKPDTFESNEKSKLSFRQWSDEFSSWVERIDQDFETLLRLAAQMQGTRTSSLPKLSKIIDWELKRSPSLINTSTLR